jgi:putative oxygen-independent coproporphyrinogen III oxidase
MKIPLSLYIHIPWCVRKCPYCDFNSHAQRAELPEAEYIAKLLLDLQTHEQDLQNRPIHSIFIGGGTPSLFSPQAYQTLFAELRRRLDLPAGIEITLEANPGASEQAKFCGFREAGINRLSLGVQSWNPAKLQALGRIHDAEQAVRAVEMAKSAGFTNFNIDIMHGLPQQTLEQGLEDIQQTIACEPAHISWYQLTIEPNTYFHHFPPTLPEDDLRWEIQEQGQKLLQNAGFEQYEVSAYCRNQQFSQHNLNYWQFGDYIGIGAGSHSKITYPDLSIWRYWKVKNPKDYLSKTSVLDGKRQIPHHELLFEFLMNALRLRQSIPLSLMTARTGLSATEISQNLVKLNRPDLLILNDNNLSLTQLGYRFVNEILTAII